MLSLLMLLITDPRSGFLAKLYEIDDASSKQQTLHITEGTASGKLSARGHGEKLGACVQELHDASLAASRAAPKEPVDQCRPARRWLTNPSISLLKDAAKGDEFILVPITLCDSSGVSWRDGFAKEVKELNPNHRPGQRGSNKWITSYANAGLALSVRGTVHHIALTGDEERVTVAAGDAHQTDQLAFKLACKALPDDVAACDACLQPVTGTHESASSMPVAFTGAGTAPRSQTVAKLSLLLTKGSPVGRVSPATDGLLVGTKRGESPLRIDVKVSGGANPLQADEASAPLSLLVKARRQPSEGAVSDELSCRIFAREVRVKHVELWPKDAQLWRAMCDDGAEITLALDLPDSWELNPSPTTDCTASSEGAALVGCIVRKWWERGTTRVGYLGIIEAYDEGVGYLVRYPDNEREHLALVAADGEEHSSGVRYIMIPDSAWRLVFADADTEARRARFGSISLTRALTGLLDRTYEWAFEQKTKVDLTTAAVPAALARWDELEILLPTLCSAHERRSATLTAVAAVLALLASSAMALKVSRSGKRSQAQRLTRVPCTLYPAGHNALLLQAQRLTCVPCTLYPAGHQCASPHIDHELSSIQ